MGWMLMIRNSDARDVTERFQGNSIPTSSFTCNRRAGRKRAHGAPSTHHFYGVDRKNPRIGHWLTPYGRSIGTAYPRFTIDRFFRPIKSE